jgi:hypothetical protein
LSKWINLSSANYPNTLHARLPPVAANSVDVLMQTAHKELLSYKTGKKDIKQKAITAMQKFYKHLFGTQLINVSLNTFWKLDSRIKILWRKHTKSLHFWDTYPTRFCTHTPCFISKTKQSPLHLFRDCPTTLSLTSAFSLKLDAEIKHLTNGNLSFISLWFPSSQSNHLPNPHTLTYWLLLGYLPRHIATVSDSIFSLHPSHDWATPNLLRDTILRRTISLYHKIQNIRTTCNKIFNATVHNLITEKDGIIEQQEPSPPPVPVPLTSTMAMPPIQLSSPSSIHTLPSTSSPNHIPLQTTPSHTPLFLLSTFDRPEWKQWDEMMDSE